MNILVTINKNYLNILFTMLNSLKTNNKNTDITVYIVSNDVNDEDLTLFFNELKMEYKLIRYKDEILDNAPTSKRYPSVIYYRLLAANYLPTYLDRILYLDPDLVVLKDLSKLYNMDFKDNYYIGASNVKKVLRKFNEIKNKAPKDSIYLNNGVLLINLNLLRKRNNLSKEIYDYIVKNKLTLFLPDQDILQALYGNKVIQVDNLLYNLSDRTINRYNFSHRTNKIDLNWVDKNCYIIHYFGRNKPWKENYRGILKGYYLKYKR